MREAERKAEGAGRSGKNGERKYFPFPSKLTELLTMMMGSPAFFSPLTTLLPPPDSVPAVPTARNIPPAQLTTRLNPSFLSLRSRSKCYTLSERPFLTPVNKEVTIFPCVIVSSPAPCLFCRGTQ